MKILCKAVGAADGHTRITRGEDFLIAGGDEKTHRLLQETIIKLSKELQGSPSLEKILRLLSNSGIDDVGQIERIEAVSIEGSDDYPGTDYQLGR